MKMAGLENEVLVLAQGSRWSPQGQGTETCPAETQEERPAASPSRFIPRGGQCLHAQPDQGHPVSLQVSSKRPAVHCGRKDGVQMKVPPLTCPGFRNDQ